MIPDQHHAVALSYLNVAICRKSVDPIFRRNPMSSLSEVATRVSGMLSRNSTRQSRGRPAAEGIGNVQLYQELARLTQDNERLTEQNKLLEVRFTLRK